MSASDFLAESGAMGARILACDWSGSPLGRIEAWPRPMLSALSLLLRCRFPIYMAWGPDLIGFYNDAFRPLLGAKPEALGRPAREVWPEAWSRIEPILARVLQGEGLFFEDLPVIVGRRGYP